MDPKRDERFYNSVLQRRSNSNESQSSKKRVVLTRIIKLSPSENHAVYKNLAEEMQNTGELHKSSFALKKAIIIDPSCDKTQMKSANTLFRLEKENQAYSHIKKALSLSPESQILHTFLIEKLEEKHRLEDLESFLKEIIDMIPNPKSIPLLYFNSAGALLNCGQSSQAVSMYRKAIESDLPMGYTEHYNYGTALYYQGLFDDAMLQFEHAKRHNPDDIYALNNIAHVHYCLGRVQKARKEFEFLVQNGLETYLTRSSFLLVLCHLDEDEKIINKYKKSLEPSIVLLNDELIKIYNDQAKITQKILERENIDEETRKFNNKKLVGINFLLSLIKGTSKASSLAQEL